MGFFKDFKEDLSQAVNELSDDAAKMTGTADKAKEQEPELPADDAMVDTLMEEEADVTDADLEASLSRMDAQR